MKPQYILFLMFAVFITGLSDGISWALLALPGIGIILDFVVEISINATMGAGLLMLLIMNGMYHPKFGPFAIIGGLLPGLNILPFWIGLVIVGIVHKTAQEGGALSTVAKLAEGMQSAGSNPVAQMSAIGSTMNERRAAGRPEAPLVVQDNEGPSQPTRTPLELKSPRITTTINSDISPRAANDNHFPYAQKAA